MSQDFSVLKEEAELLGSSRVGAYQWLRLQAPGIAQRARPGQFVAVAVGGATSGHLLRRCFSIHRVDPLLGNVELVVAAHGPGTVWLTDLAAGAQVDLVGPLGRPFPLPTEPVPCVLVGGGYGSAPLFWLADVLRDRGCHTETRARRGHRRQALRGRAGRRECRRRRGDHRRRFGRQPWLGERRSAASDLTMRTRPWSTPAGRCRCCGRSTEQAQAAGAVAQVAVEEAMACGVGCLHDVRACRSSAQDGRTAMVRSCLDGPVFRGDLVRWDAFSDGLCHVPPDAVGAPQPTASGGH
jgi:dihydroorotate dehydrogenase electron transfer subunit